MLKKASWGGFPDRPQTQHFLKNRFCEPNETHFLPYGLGRSYGDSCLHSDGALLSSALLDQFIGFDEESGILCCESGVRFVDIIQSCLPRGWFLPVTPGTQFVTVGGAVANDVHGKNHESAGSFGHHILEFELVRSTGERLICSPESNAEYFHATIGGLGLSGFITWVTLQLKPVSSDKIDTETLKYGHLDDFFRINDDTDNSFEYRVAWLDCTASGNQLGRGHFISGRHVKSAGQHTLSLTPKRNKSVPLTPPFSLINNLSVSLFNRLYYAKQQQRRVSKTENHDTFFYPLDAVLHWNRLYGKSGFLQHQSVIPRSNARPAIKELLERIEQQKTGSFLVVLKMLGAIKNRGLLSFPMEGVTLAMDFPYQGKKTLAFLSTLEDIVEQAGGRMYPAKDANMRAEHFQCAYPNWKQVEKMRDPAINSDFWQRVTGIGAGK